MDKKQELAMFLAQTKGIIDPASQEAEITKMANDCPTATAAEKGLATDVDKAYETMLIMKGQQSQAPATATSAPVATMPTSGISAAEELNIVNTLAAQRQDRAAVSANTSLEQLILDRPEPKDIIKSGTMGTIVEKGWANLMEKIEKGIYRVKPDDGEEIDAEKRIPSTTNFNALKAAHDAGKAVEVMIGKLNTKPIGYMVRKGTNTGTAQQPEQMTREGLERFMILETAGYVLASDTKPGARLRYVKARQNANSPGVSSQGKTMLADANKAAAIESGSFVISREITNDVESTSCKSALSFRVEVAGKTMKDGVTPVTRTVRVGLKSDLPILRRKDEFVDVFGTGERESNSQLLAPPTGKQAQGIEEAQRKAIAALRQKSMDPNQAASVADINEQLQAFAAPASQAPGVTL